MQLQFDRGRRSLWQALRVLALGLTASVEIGCGDATGESAQRVAIMVIDHGFDLSHPLLKDRIVAAFTLQCAGQAAGRDGSTSSAEIVGPDKATILAELSHTDERCQLEPGIVSAKNPFPDLESQRLDWNRALASNQFEQAPPIAEQLFTRLIVAPFHGTATAGLIAYGNPAADLILLERPVQGLTIDDSSSEDCPTQQEVDARTAWLSDSDIRAAFLARPRSSVEQAIEDLALERDVKLINESYGTLSRQGLEDLLARKQCPALALRAYFSAMNALDQQYDAAHPWLSGLVVKAAGNDGALLSGPDDSVECRRGGSERLLVGGYGFDGRPSLVSNYGSCVDVFAPADVLAPIPGDWWVPLSGTSFSAPLIARLASEQLTEPFDRERLRSDVLGLRNDAAEIDRENFPPALQWGIVR
jgi:subtilisin family serine protease